jgi:hypothetical protein
MFMKFKLYFLNPATALCPALNAGLPSLLFPEPVMA